jgi:DNA-binding MarR family transcriptional regulator
MGMFLLQALPTPDDLERFKARYPDLDPDSVALFLRVLSCGSNALLALDAFLGQYGLSHGRWITLILLQRNATPQTRLSTLAEQQGVTKATMTGLIQGLESGGLVAVKPDASDGRSRLVELTPEGLALLDQIMPDYYRQVANLARALTSAEQQDAAALLDRLAAALPAFNDEDHP